MRPEFEEVPLVRPFLSLNSPLQDMTHPKQLFSIGDFNDLLFREYVHSSQLDCIGR